MDLTQQEWSAQQAASKDSIILDVRTSEEYLEGHIPNAKLLDIRDPHSFMEGVSELDVSKPILFTVDLVQEALRPVRYLSNTE